MNSLDVKIKKLKPKKDDIVFLTIKNGSDLDLNELRDLLDTFGELKSNNFVISNYPISMKKVNKKQIQLFIDQEAANVIKGIMNEAELQQAIEFGKQNKKHKYIFLRKKV
jgi:hypothetical protein